jgi:hypothetical protein
MASTRIARRYSAILGGTALVALGVLSAACGNNGSENTPATTTTTSTATTTATTSGEPPITPTEKGISPTGGNSFGPQVLAPPAPTEPPGVHRHRN